MKPPFETFKGPTCRGSYAFGNQCGHCEKCEWELGEISKLTDDPPKPNERLLDAVHAHREMLDRIGLRDWFAGMALQALITHYGLDNRADGARISYEFADAMLAKRGPR